MQMIQNTSAPHLSVSFLRHWAGWRAKPEAKRKYCILSSSNIAPLPQGCKWNGLQKWSDLLSPLQMLFSHALQVALSYLKKPLQLQAVMGGNEDGGQRLRERGKRLCISNVSSGIQQEHACILMRGHLSAEVNLCNWTDNSTSWQWFMLRRLLKFNAQTLTQIQLPKHILTRSRERSQSCFI